MAMTFANGHKASGKQNLSSLICFFDLFSDETHENCIFRN